MMAQKGILLSETDAKRLEAVLRYVERHMKDVNQHRRRPRIGLAASTLYIAMVDSDATSGGHYNCHLQNVTGGTFSDIGDSVVVLNLAEQGSNIHNLDAGDLILCWDTADSTAGNQLTGVEILGRHTFGEW